MPTDPRPVLLNRLRTLAEALPRPEASDRELLHRFVTHRDEASFETLVRRHGGMVLRVCRRVLANAADAEDAFQATFFLLARKASSTHWHSSVANWLYGVAHRLARKAKEASSRRTRKESGVTLSSGPDPLAEITGRELAGVLDEELVRLPEKYREPVVLCYLEGLTRDEAARRLGCPLSTVKHRTARGKVLLAQALVRRGVGMSVALLATLAVVSRGKGAVPLSLLRPTLRGIRAGLDGLAPGTSALLRGETPVTGLTKVKALVTLALLGMVAAGAVLVARQVSPADPPKDAGPPMPVQEQKPQAVDGLGDPLPAGALMRLGTRRHRVQTWPFLWRGLPDGKSYLVHHSLGVASEIRRLDSATGRVIESWPIPRQQNAAGVSPDGRYLLLSTEFIHFSGIRLGGQKEEQEWNLTLYDLVRRENVWTNSEMLEAFNWKRVDSALFSPDGKWIVSQGTFGGGLRLWDAATGKELWHKEKEAQTLEPLGFVADGDTLVLCGREDNTIVLVERKSGKKLRSFSTMSRKESDGACLAPDGSAVLLGTYSPEVRVWDLATGKERPALTGHEKWARRIAFSPDGKTVATGGNDAFVLVREWPSGRIVRTIELGRGSIEEMAVSGDSRRLEVVSWGEQALRSYDLETGKALATFPDCHQGNVYGVVVAPDGALLSFGKDSAVRTWDLKTGKAVGRLKVEQDLNAGGFALSADGRFLAASNSDNRAVSVYERATGRLVRNLTAERGVGTQIVIAPDGRWVAGVDPSSGVFQVWEVATGKQMLRLHYQGVAYGVTCAFSPDGRQFVTSEHGVVHFWDVNTWKEQSNLKAYAPLGLAFSPDGRTLATAGVEGIQLFELATGCERAHFRSKGYPSGSLRFSPDGRRLACVSDHKTIHVWEVLRGELLSSFTGHDDRVTGLAFAADGRTLVSSSEDSTLLIWDVAGLAAEAVPAKDGDLEQAWKALACEDSKAAHEAIRVLVTSPQGAVERIGRHLKPVLQVDADPIKASLRDLDSDKFSVREQATRNLEKMGEGVVGMLEQYLAGQPSLEAKRRVEAILASFTGPEQLRRIRALEVLERIGDDQALRVLEALGQGMPEAWLTREAKAAMDRLGQGNGKGLPGPR